MRRLILVVMIAMLPLRGWAAEAMSVVMAAQALDSVTIIVDDADTIKRLGQDGTQTPTEMPAGCPMPAADTTGDATPSPFNTCSTCQLCMGLVTGYGMNIVGAAALPLAVQSVAGSSFTSAERAASFKPPIP